MHMLKDRWQDYCLIHSVFFCALFTHGRCREELLPRVGASLSLVNDTIYLYGGQVGTPL